MNRTHRAAAALLLALAGFACPVPAQASAAAPPACTEEGFFPNPDDQSMFYRCVDFDGTFTRFDFQCGPGTLYHPELVTCVHPWQMPPE